MELTGKTAVITGSSGQLGGAIALALGEGGCNCVCHYSSDRRKAEELVGQIKGLGVKAAAVGADLSEAGQIESLFEKAAEIGEPQVLINSAQTFLVISQTSFGKLPPFVSQSTITSAPASAAAAITFIAYSGFSL